MRLHKMCVFSVMQVYKGYVDDSRNTDNAWMETSIITLHCDKHTPLMADLNRIVSRKDQWYLYNLNVGLSAKMNTKCFSVYKWTKNASKMHDMI